MDLIMCAANIILTSALSASSHQLLNDALKYGEEATTTHL
jgi:hypothetical protein